ncbi:MAG: hypothetical protein LQ338_007889 [Usnochroma carphineum]|nr:MAG: hypothetical protein LQ338_007889 [Usnochroma carphineum]
MREEYEERGDQRIRDFLKVRTSYDVLPLSFRLIIFDTSLLVKKSLTILTQNGIVSAPLWDSKTSTFAGLLTTSDYINLIQYYWQNPDAVNRIDQFKLNSLRDIEKAIGVSPLETASIHPLKPLYDACRRMLETRARRIPLIDTDDETGRAMVVSVVTQYRILKFVAVNVHETQMLRKPLRHLNLGTYKDLVTANMETSVFEVIHKLVNYNISSIPILNSDGVVTNVFEAVDVITLIKGANYDELNLNVGEALQKRSEDFPGIFTCSIDDRLDTIFDTIRKSRVHRFVVIDEESRLVGVLTLSDILEYMLLEGEGDDTMNSADAIMPEVLATCPIPRSRSSIIYYKGIDDHLIDLNRLARRHNVVLIYINAPSKKPLPTGLSKKTEKRGHSLAAIGSRFKLALSDKKRVQGLRLATS